jgi:hypothetical protein
MRNSSSLCLLVVFVLIAATGTAQNLVVSNLSIDHGGVISFVATIDKSHSDRELYDLSIFHSRNDYQSAIAFQQRDMEPGEIYRLSFDANREIGRFEGDVQLRFDIKASQFPLKPNITANQSLKRGKLPDLTWQDYQQVAPYKVELYKDGQLLQVIEDRTSDNRMTVTLPDKLEKGDGYAVKVVSLSNQSLNSDLIPVRITSKIGLAFKLAPLVAIGVGAAVLLSGSEDSPEEGFSNPPSEPND